MISVSDKRDIYELSKCLASHNVDIISTGGTASYLRKRKIKIQDVSKLTGFPEMMGGRLKTLHPIIHGGILFRRNLDSDWNDVRNHGIIEINLVIVNLYPFKTTVLSGNEYSSCLENIDIGGPTMIRAAAKNFDYVCVIVDPHDYKDLIAELNETDGKISSSFRKKMAIKAFQSVSNYDYDVQSWLSGAFDNNSELSPRVNKTIKLRYGENPHQKASLELLDEGIPSIVNARQVQGKELSYNNYIDADTAFKIISEFNEKKDKVCVIVKHNNPCGVAKGKTASEAYLKAYLCYPTSAFAGIIAINSVLDESLAREVVKNFCEVIVAPRVLKKAASIINKKRPNVRILEVFGLFKDQSVRKERKEILGGALFQEANNISLEQDKIKYATKLRPSSEEFEDLLFSWRIVKYVSSNAIIIVKNGQTVGIGNGQTSRLDSVKIAVNKAKGFFERSQGTITGAVAASDAFFPFADGIVELAKAGVNSVIQPGGSIKDEEVVDVANKRKISMIFTGIRHFSH